MERTMSSVKVRGSRPSCMACATAASTRPWSFATSASMISSVVCTAWSSAPPETTSSSADNVSRALPPPWRRTRSMDSSSTVSPASLMTNRTYLSSSSTGSRWNCRCWTRLRMVSATFCGSVVASTNTTWSGGSSRVFSNAASAAFESMCTSSRMNTRWRPGLASAADSMRSRISCTPLLLAASSSRTS